jgi:two-component system response regulator PilR (NtrC family)
MRSNEPVSAAARSDAKKRIMVVDDELSMREYLSILLRKQGYQVDAATGGEEALEKIERELYDLVITDLSMPRVDGMAVLQRVKEVSPTTEVILITAFATTESAVEAMKRGAYDYIIKPFKNDELKIIIEKALEQRRLLAENQLLRQEVESRYGFGNLVGSSPAMLEVYDLIRKVKDTRTNVLISGESGTGKEVVAKALHYNGNRKDFPFVTINCGAIPESLIESELFGHKRGAFTGAITNKPGLFQTAHGGTLLLDEIGEMPLGTQVKLLRAIQERSFKNLGGVEEIKVDVRVIAATNRNLAQEIKAGRFREDLYYRLNVIQIKLPPVRERMEDLPHLIDHFLVKFSQEYDKPIRGIHEDALRALLSYTYPGNIRELANIIERAVALESTDRIHRPSLPPHLLSQVGEISERVALELPPEGLDLDAVVGELEKHLLLQALERSQGVKKRAAKLLRISFRSLRYRLAKYGMEAGDAEEEDE